MEHGKVDINIDGADSFYEINLSNGLQLDVRQDGSKIHLRVPLDGGGYKYMIFYSWEKKWIKIGN